MRTVPKGPYSALRHEIYLWIWDSGWTLQEFVQAVCRRSLEDSWAVGRFMKTGRMPEAQFGRHSMTTIHTADDYILGIRTAFEVVKAEMARMEEC